MLHLEYDQDFIPLAKIWLIRIDSFTEFPVETTTAAAQPTDPPTEKTTEFPTDFPPDTDEYSPPYPDSCKQNITHVCK